MAAVREMLGGGRGGVLGELIRRKDWSRTPLGDQSGWPPSLQTAVAICLNSRVPLMVVWGEEKAALYNDALRPILGDGDGHVLGAPAQEVWSEVWPVAGPLLEDVLASGEATWSRDVMFPVRRQGFVEEAYFSFSCTPVFDGRDDEVAGALIGLSESTDHVLSERRFALIEVLGARTIVATGEEEACIRAARALARDTADIPFALFYLADESRHTARLVAATGIGASSPAVAPLVDLCAGGDASGWPLPLANRTAVPVDDVYLRFGPVVAEPWPEHVRRAVILPLRRASERSPFGYLVLGLSPRLPFDTRYAGFLDLIAEHSAAAIENARAYHTQRRRAEVLAEIERTRTQFFSNVSHEFRTPLTLILGPITDAINSPERALRGNELEVVHRNALRLLKLTNTLLDFSRIEAGQMHANYRPTHLAMLTTDLASTFRAAIEHAGLRFEVSCDHLGQPVHVDRDMWEKIILNLLSNALKFTFEGSIRVHLATEGEQVVLEVEDTGVGIDAAEIPRVFDRFYRGANTRARSDEGAGIGLTLVRELAELQGGSVEVESEVGRGTRFRVSLPLHRPELPAARAADPIPETDLHANAYLVEALQWVPEPPAPADGVDPAETALPTPKVAHAGRILVADDNADMRDYLARLLRTRWEVETVADGAKALAALERSRPDLIVADVTMPVLDGLGVIRAVRGDPARAEIPILLLSARAGEDAIAEGLRAGADDCLVKPFAANAVLVRAEKLIAEARARAAEREATDAERRRLEMMFDDSPAAVLVVRGPELILDFANRNAMRVWGGASPKIGAPLGEAIPDLGDAETIDSIREVLKTGRPVHRHNALTRLDRNGNGILTDVYFDFAWIPLRERDGTVSSVFIHAFEVTELVTERRAAETANRMKDEFLATVSHELRAPLNAILGWTSLLRSNPGRDLRDRALATIERSVRTQVRLIEDILDVERIVSGKLRLEMTRVSVETLVNAAVDIVRPAAEEKHVGIEVNVHPDSGWIDGDPDRLQQVVCNLLINSVKFTPEGGTIALHARRSDATVTLRVRDNGVGIPQQHLPHVFERFRQAGTITTERESGLGLGLEIVRSLVELHGGTVSAQSLEGFGTTFTVTLPGGTGRAALVEAVNSEQ